MQMKCNEISVPFQLNQTKLNQTKLKKHYYKKYTPKKSMFHCLRQLQHFSHGKKAWFNEHVRDPFVKRAAKENYRSRAAFKLEEILLKYKFKAEKILDLGCSPGSWSQMAKSIFPKAQILGIDLLETKPIEGVELHKGDACDPQFHKILANRQLTFDLIISDMAPNFMGDLATTHQQTIQLNILCMGLSAALGAKGCNLIMKTVYGRLEKNIFTLSKELFENVSRVKPDSSRSHSVQFYYVCSRMKQQYQNAAMLQKISEIDLETIRSQLDCKQLLQ